MKKLEITPFLISHYGSTGAHNDIDVIKTVPVSLETSSDKRAKRKIDPLYLNWRVKRYPDKRRKRNENNSIPRS